MKKQAKKRLLWALLLWVNLSANAQPDWNVNPAAFQYSMTLVAQLQVNDLPNGLPNNHLAFFSDGQIRGYATPVSFNGQAYYFVNLYSNQYKDDTLYIRAYLANEQKIYESPDTMVFRHHQNMGTIGEPFQIHLYLGERPLIYTLPTVSYMENTCPDILDVEATDNLNSEGDGLTYSIAGGADSDRFSIDLQTGLLSWFNFAPDAAIPEDADGDNRYEVLVRVTDASGLFDEQHITVTVVNSTPLPPLVCPDDLALASSDNGPGDCGTTTDQTAIPLPNTCAASALTYQLSGATTGNGIGLVPSDQMFLKGLTTVYYFQNSGGNISECAFFVTVQDDEPPTLSCPGDLTVSPNLFNPCAAMVGDINAGFSDNCPGTTLSYAFSGATNGGGSGQAGGQTFLLGATTVTYTVIDGTDLSTSCSFTVTVSNCNTEFAGSILWEHDGSSGVKDATVSLTGSATGNDLTDLNGDYLISLPYQTGNFVLKPTKNINKTNGLTSADVTAIQQHITNISPLPVPFKRIAADVNKSNSITSLDATLVNQVLLGNPQANAIFNTSWRFVPTAYTFPNPNLPWGFPEQINLIGVSGHTGDQDFYGIKLGDVVSTWANPANFGVGERLVFRVQDRVLDAGAEIVTEFRADQLDDLNSFQFALYFDPGQLQLVEIEPLNDLPVSPENFGTFNSAEGEIRVVWAQATPLLLSEATPVFRLRFKALESGARLSEALQLNEAALPARAYNSKYAESGVELQFSTPTGTEQWVADAGLLLTNQPNPFVEVTTLYFVLPQAGQAELRVSDATGRLMFSQKKHYAAGLQQEMLRLERASGMLFVELVTEQGRVARKILAREN